MFECFREYAFDFTSVVFHWFAVVLVLQASGFIDRSAFDFSAQVDIGRGGFGTVVRVPFRCEI